MTKQPDSPNPKDNDNGKGNNPEDINKSKKSDRIKEEGKEPKAHRFRIFLKGKMKVR